MARLLDDGNSEYFLVSSFTGVSSEPYALVGFFLDDSTAINDRSGFELHDSSQADRFGRIGRNSSGTSTRAVNRWDTGAPTGATAGNITQNEYFNLAGEFNSATSRFAVFNGSKGAEVTTNNGSAVGVDGLAIGREYNNDTGADFWSGGVAELAVYKAALDDAQYIILSLGFSALFVRPADLVTYFPMIAEPGFTGNEQDLVGGLIAVANNAPSTIDHPPIIYPTGQLSGFLPASVAAADKPTNFYKLLLAGAA